MKKPVLKIKFYSDPSHGWYAVKRFSVGALGILRMVSPYSYQRGDMVYLEEDCDATLLFTAAKLIGLEVKVTNMKPSNKSSRIRSYPQFVSPAILEEAERCGQS